MDLSMLNYEKNSSNKQIKAISFKFALWCENVLR